MLTYDMYGSRAQDMDQLRTDVEAVLGVQFEPHWSDIRGGDYFLWRSKDTSSRERFTITRNHHLTLGDYHPVMETDEPEFGEYQLLLRVDRSRRGDEVKSKLMTVTGLDFLQRDGL